MKLLGKNLKWNWNCNITNAITFKVYGEIDEMEVLYGVRIWRNSEIAGVEGTSEDVKK